MLEETNNIANQVSQKKMNNTPSESQPSNSASVSQKQPNRMVPVLLAILLIVFTFGCSSNGLPQEEEVIKLMESTAKEYFMSQMPADDINFVLLSSAGIDISKLIKIEVTELSQVEKIDRKTYSATTPISVKTYDQQGKLVDDQGELLLIEWKVKYSGKYVTVEIEDTTELQK